MQTTQPPFQQPVPPSPPPKKNVLVRHWKPLAALSVVGLAAAAWLAFGFFGIQSAFIDDKVDEAGPIFDSGAEADDAPGSNDGERSRNDDSDPAGGETDDPQDQTGDNTDDSEESEPSIQTVAEGNFSGTSRYDVAGTATVLTDGSEQRFVRFADFDSSNGPDLKVYLATDGDVSGDFVSLGNLKGNIGSQNYEIPTDVDLSELDTVVIWCERFGVGFGSAELT